MQYEPSGVPKDDSTDVSTVAPFTSFFPEALTRPCGVYLSMNDSRTNRDWEKFIKSAEERSSAAQEDNNVGPQLRTPEDVAELIDHTLLKLDATPEQIDTLCAEARSHGFKTVCVRVPYVSRAVSNLAGTSVGIAAVVSFPHGTSSLDDKVQEAKDALQAGATELDIVLNYSLLQQAAQHISNSAPAAGPSASQGDAKSMVKTSDLERDLGSMDGKEGQLPDYTTIFHELATLRSTCPPPTVLKLILETSQLDRHQIFAACIIAKAAQFDFVKTSTGFRGQGATVENVALMHAVVAGQKRVKDGEGDDDQSVKLMQVKASGGIRTLQDVRRMVGAGASRIGTSAGVEIMRQMRAEVEREGGLEKG